MRHLRGYAALEQAGLSGPRLVAVCDADPERAGAAGARFQTETGRPVELLSGLDEVLARGQVDAVDLVLPTRLHHQAVLAALDAGKHVLVEKPFGLTIRACDAMRDGAQRTGLTLAVAENYRRIPSNRALHALVTSGAIGRPYAVSVHTVQPAAPRPGRGWFFDRRWVGSLPMLELAVHEADLLRHLFGDVVEAYAMLGRFEAGEAEDAGVALLRFGGGTLGQLLVLTAGHGGAAGGRLIAAERGRVTSGRWEGWEDGEVAVEGEPAVASADWIRSWLDGLAPDPRQRLLPDRTWDPSELRVDVQDPLRYGIATELHDFADAVASGRPPEVGAEAGTAAVAVCLAVLESAALNAPVAIADVTSGRVRTWQQDLDRELGLDS